MTYSRDENIHISQGERRGAWINHSKNIAISRCPGLPGNHTWGFVCLFNENLIHFDVHAHEVDNNISALRSYDKGYRSFRVTKAWVKMSSGEKEYKYEEAGTSEFLLKNNEEICEIISEFLDQITKENPTFFFTYVNPRR